MIQQPLCVYFKYDNFTESWSTSEIVKIKIYGVTKILENPKDIIFYLYNGQIVILDKNNNIIKRDIIHNCEVAFDRSQILNTIRVYIRSDLN